MLRQGWKEEIEDWIDSESKEDLTIRNKIRIEMLRSNTDKS